MGSYCDNDNNLVLIQVVVTITTSIDIIAATSTKSSYIVLELDPKRATFFSISFQFPSDGWHLPDI